VAAELFVDDDTCPSTGSGTESDPYCAIQSAVNAASTGDTITVRPGTYDDFDFASEAITVRSSNGPKVTTITHTGGHPKVQFGLGDGDSTLEGFTITGGTGIGIQISNGPSPTIRGNIITGNGGGIDIIGGSAPLIEDTIIGPDNDATNGGGVFATGDLDGDGDTPVRYFWKLGEQ
jgi:parallel beta-helix repeat protein